MGIGLAPVAGDEARAGQHVDVRCLVHGDHVAFQPGHNRLDLLAGAAVGLVDRKLLARLALPLGGKGGVDVLVQLAGDVVGDVQQGRVGVGRGHAEERRAGHQRTPRTAAQSDRRKLEHGDSWGSDDFPEV